MTIKVINAFSEMENVTRIWRATRNTYISEAEDAFIQVFNFPDVDTLDDLEGIMEITAQRATNDTFNGYDSAYGFFYEDVNQLERISKNSNLYQWLRAWYGRNGVDADEAMAEGMTGFYENDDAIYFVHGTGYNVIAKDILNEPEADFAENDFYNFLNK